MIRIAIAGMGWAGSRHVEAIRELGGKVAVECLVDQDEGHLYAKGKDYGVGKRYATLDVALLDLDVDAVSICLPHALHCDAAVACAQAGKHVLVEKPIALSVKDAVRMIDAADHEGVRLYVAENVVYSAMSKYIKEAVDGGLIGKVVTASVTAGFRGHFYGYQGRREWLSNPALGGTGTWMLHGIHTMAQVRFVFGEVASVYMTEHQAGSFSRPELEGTMVGLLTMESGLSITVVQSCELRLKDTGEIRIYGDAGSVWADGVGARLYLEGGVKRTSYPDESPSSYALEMEAFADYITEGVEGPTTGRSETQTLAIVQAGYKSAESGEVVHFGPRFGDL